MVILVLLCNANKISLSNLVYMLSSKGTYTLINITSPIHIQIYSRRLLLHYFRRTWFWLLVQWKVYGWFCIILCYYAFKWKYIQLGKYYFTCLDTSMPLNCETTVVIVMEIGGLVLRGKCEDIFSIELYNYAIYWWFLQLGKCYLNYPASIISYRSDTTFVSLIWMWLLVSLKNEKIFLVSNCINMPSSNDTNNMWNATLDIQIRICHWEVMIQWLF